MRTSHSARLALPFVLALLGLPSEALAEEAKQTFAEQFAEADLNGDGLLDLAWRKKGKVVWFVSYLVAGKPRSVTALEAAASRAHLVWGTVGAAQRLVLAQGPQPVLSMVSQR